MNCQQCSGKMIRMVPEGDTHERWVCDSCEAIFYEKWSQHESLGGCLGTFLAMKIMVFLESAILEKTRFSPRRKL